MLRTTSITLCSYKSRFLVFYATLISPKAVSVKGFNLMSSVFYFLPNYPYHKLYFKNSINCNLDFLYSRGEIRLVEDKNKFA